MPVMTVSDDLPLRVARPVHSGKVRSVYWLGADDSRRLIEERGYAVAADSLLAIMVISDRLSAFDCLWRSDSLAGVPGKGAALNRIAAHWFASLADAGLPSNHLLEMPHPMLWVVRQARPIMVEAIARQYLTGSLWRAYEAGARDFAGVRLPDGLARYAQLPEVLFTPSTKGVLRGLEGVPEYDDAPVSAATVAAHHAAFGFRAAADVATCRDALLQGFAHIAAAYAALGEILVDTKFEFGYAPGPDGEVELIYMDEVATPDSSRIWLRSDWEAGQPREHSKEMFREALLDWVPDRDLLLDSARMDERSAFAAANPVPDSFFLDLAQKYEDAAQRITGGPSATGDRPRDALLDILNEQFRLLD